MTKIQFFNAAEAYPSDYGNYQTELKLVALLIEAGERKRDQLANTTGNLVVASQATMQS